MLSIVTAMIIKGCWAYWWL